MNTLRNRNRDAGTWPATSSGRDANTWPATKPNNAQEILQAMRDAERSRKHQSGGGLQFTLIDNHFYVKILSLILIVVALILMYVPELDYNRWIAGSIMLFIASIIIGFNLLSLANKATIAGVIYYIINSILFIITGIIGTTLIYVEINKEEAGILVHPIVETSLQYLPWAAGATGLITLLSLWEKTD